MPPAVIPDGNEEAEEHSSIGSFDHVDSSILSVVSVTAAVATHEDSGGGNSNNDSSAVTAVVATHAGTPQGSEDYGGGNGNNDSSAVNSNESPSAALSRVHATLDSSISNAANTTGDDNGAPSQLHPKQRHRKWYIICVVGAATVVAVGFSRLIMEVRQADAARKREMLRAECYKSICEEQYVELGKLQADLVKTTSSLRMLQANVSEYTSRRIGSDTLNVELEPLPRLLMRDIWDEHEHKVVSALSQLLTSRECGYNISNDYPWGHVIMIMARWKRSAIVQYYGCQILGRLPTRAQKRAAAFGALEVILEAMKTFPADENLQHHALFALHHLCVKHNGNMMRLVERLSGVPVVLASLRAFPESGLTQYWGCRLLEVLSRKNQFMGAIRQAGGLSVLSNIYVMWHNGSTDIDRAIMEIARSSLAALIRRHSGA